MGLTKGRFWSSPEKLPVERVIARVLADPVESDVYILKNHFGIKLLQDVWEKIKEREEVAESVIPVTENILKTFTDD